MNFNKPVLHLRNIDDIGFLLPGKYGLPITSNFPLVDAIIQPNMLLQMTVSAQKHRGADMGKLSAIRDQLMEKDVSVVPRKSLKTFQYQEDLDDISQYLLCPDPSVQNRKRKQKTNGKHQQHSFRDPVAEVPGPMAQMSVDGKINTKGSIKKAAAAPASDMPPDPPVAAAVGSVAGASKKNAKKKGQKKSQQAAGGVEETKVAPPLPANPSHGDDAPGSGHKLKKKKKSAAAESITAATAPMSPNSAPVVKQEKDENKKSETAT
jgi:hypothetical protein